MKLIRGRRAMRQVRKTEAWQCWYCRRPVGYIGRAIAWLVGVGHHGCDFSNVSSDQEGGK